MANTNTINKITIGDESRYIEDEYLVRALKYILGYSEDKEFNRNNGGDGNTSLNWSDLPTIKSFIDEHNNKRIDSNIPDSPNIHLKLADIDNGDRGTQYLNGNAEYVTGFKDGDDLSTITSDNNKPVLVSGLNKVLDCIYKYLGKTDSSGPITFQIV